MNSEVEEDAFGGYINRRAEREQRERIEAFQSHLETKQMLDTSGLQTGKDIYDTQQGMFSNPEDEVQGTVPYFMLLERGYQKMAEKNPGLTRQQKCTIKPPNVKNGGAKRTLYTNIEGTAEALNRPLDHLKEFLFAELGTTGSFDGNRALTLKGRFRTNQIQNVLRQYANGYIVCQSCSSSDTKLVKDTARRLQFLICSNCQAKRAVTGIRAGYRATQRGDRRAARNASAQ